MARKAFKILEHNGQTLIISNGGNTKTKQVVELTLVPTFIANNWSEIKGTETNCIKQGKLYVNALKNRIQTVCPSECSHLQNNSCYVQHNPRNAAQVAGILNHLVGFLTSVELRLWLKTQKIAGFTDIRSMVAGDAGTIPENVWKPLEKVLLSVFQPKSWLGYTHAWKTAVWLQKTHVASVDSPEEAQLARAQGWAVFETNNPVVDKLPAGATLCPSSKQFENFRGFKIPCVGCPIKCNGTTGKHVVIPRHAMGDTGKWRKANKENRTIVDFKGRVRGIY